MYLELCIACKKGDVAEVKAICQNQSFSAYDMSRAYWYTEHNRLAVAEYMFSDPELAIKANIHLLTLNSIERCFIYDGFFEVADYLIKEFEVQDLSSAFMYALEYGEKDKYQYIHTHYESMVKQVKLAQIIENREDDALLFLLDYNYATPSQIISDAVEVKSQNYVRELLKAKEEKEMLEINVESVKSQNKRIKV